MTKTLKERFISEIYDDVGHGLDALDLLIDMIDLMPEDILAQYINDNSMLPEEEGDE